MARPKAYFRSRLQMERKQRGWDVERVAQEMRQRGHVKWTAITAAETESRRNLNQNEIASLCAIYGISADELLGTAAILTNAVPGSVKTAGHRRKNRVPAVFPIAS